MVEESKTFDVMTSDDVFQVMERRSIVGVVMESLQTSSIERKKENYHSLEEQVADFVGDNVDSDFLQKQLLSLIEKNEVIVVTFRKVKKNGKIGNKQSFNKGFFYYTGREPEVLSKIYVHWDEEKKFIIDNVQGLCTKNFFVEKQIVQFSKNILYFFISLYSNGVLLAEVSLYIGYHSN